MEKQINTRFILSNNSLINPAIHTTIVTWSDFYVNIHYKCKSGHRVFLSIPGFICNFPQQNMFVFFKLWAEDAEYVQWPDFYVTGCYKGKSSHPRPWLDLAGLPVFKISNKINNIIWPLYIFDKKWKNPIKSST